MSAKPEQQFLPNLLRERRQELGLPAELPPWRSSRFLLLRGSLLGAAGLLIALASLVLLHWTESRQQRQLQALEPVEVAAFSEVMPPPLTRAPAQTARTPPRSKRHDHGLHGFDVAASSASRECFLLL